MSEGDSPPLPRRPATARPRSDAHEHENALPPTREELEAVERMHVEITRQANATVESEPRIGASMVRFHGRGPSLNFATLIRWSPAEVDERLQDVERHMRASGEWPVVSVAEGLSEPLDLVEHLARLGWTRITGEQIMFTRHPSVVPHLDPGLRVEAVTATSAIDIARLEIANFDLPPSQLGERAERVARLVDDGTIRGFLLRLVHEPVASVRLTRGEGVAGISAVGVAARHRRRGYASMITSIAVRAGLATGHGLVWLSVDPANTGGMKTYVGLGFEPAFAWSRWAAPA